VTVSTLTDKEKFLVKNQEEFQLLARLHDPQKINEEFPLIFIRKPKAF
jgi:hypothetical protein